MVRIFRSVIPLFFCCLFAHAQTDKSVAVVRSLSASIRLDSEDLWTLKERMQHYRVPGLALVVIDKGEVAFINGFGTQEAAEYKRVRPNSIFQAASVSKTFTSFLATVLSQNGVISLDTPVNKYLKNWQLESTRGYTADEVTIRQLLSHTGGTNIHGTPGYLEGEEMPSLLQLLKGESPSTSPQVKVIHRPGDDYHYSGGGYWVVQKALEDVTGKTFNALMTDYVFTPLGMSDSSFDQIMATEAGDYHAVGHQNGKVRGSGFRRYAGLASGGLYTSVKDLSAFVLELIKCYRGESSLYDKSIMQQMSKSQSAAGYGLGLIVKEYEKGQYYFEHGGVNPGFSSLFVVVPETQQGVVILANSEYPVDIMTELTHAVADVYDWPAYGSSVVSPKVVSKVQTEKISGKYVRQGEEHLAMWINWKDNKCQIHLNDLKNPMPDPLFDELLKTGDNEFLLRKYNATLRFDNTGYSEKASFTLTYLGSGQALTHVRTVD